MTGHHSQGGARARGRGGVCRQHSPPRRRGRSSSDRGSASVLVLAVGLVLLTAGMVGAAVGTAIVARHQAQVAADFAALAGAAYAINGETVACARAGELATANGAQLTGCRLDGLDLAVTVAVPVTGPAAVAGPATATARAGPIRSPTTSG